MTFAVAGLYGVKARRFILQRFIPYLTLYRAGPIHRGSLFWLMSASYIMTVYGFAVAYVALSRMHVGSFNVGKLDLIAGIYFSVATIATLRFGDIVPITSLGRLMVIGEIFLGLAYAVFFFSVIASSLREKPVETSLKNLALSSTADRPL